jgi:SRSO17 transposase
MSVVRRFAVAGLEDAARRGGQRGGLVIGALDETGQEKAGNATAGVQRQYLGCAGKVANGINTVHLAYVREHAGHVLIGARQWVPATQIKDPAASLVMGLPLDLAFRAKGQLAIDIAAGALDDGIRFDFFCGDEVYGSCTQLRAFFEERGRAYVLRVASSFRLTPGQREEVNLRRRRQHAGGQEASGGPFRREGLQGRPLVWLVVAGHRLPAASPADPAPSQDG